MSLYNTLFKFQRNIVDRFKDRSAYGLFLDMGLGKTITSLAFAEVNNCTKVLIITINAKAMEDPEIKDSWLGWAKQSDITYTAHPKWSKDAFSVAHNDIFIINYESLFSRKSDRGLQVNSRIMEFIQSCKTHNVALIVDESHKMKNLQSKQTKAIFAIQKYLKCYANRTYTYLLTGTPFTQGYIDLYSQLKALGYNETKGYFIDQFCVRGNINGLLGWQQPIVGYKNLPELYREVHRFAITIKSEDVIDLPEQVFTNHTTSLSSRLLLFTQEKTKGKFIYSEMESRHLTNSSFKKLSFADKMSVIKSTYSLDLNYSEGEALYDGKFLFGNDTSLTDIQEKISEYVPTSNMSILDVDKKLNNPFFRNIAYPSMKWLAETTGTFYLRTRQLSIGFQGNGSDATWYDNRRLEQIKSFLEINEDNYVIFYNFTPELVELYSICEELGYKIDVYCGECKSLHFYTEYSNMSEEDTLVNKKRVIIANFQSGSTGMNWQQYNKVIIASTPVYRDYAQAIKRVHRPGQKETVFYHWFYQDNWLEHHMKAALEQQVDYTEEMFETDLKRLENLMTE